MNGKETMNKIDKKIVGYSVKKPEEADSQPSASVPIERSGGGAAGAEVIRMHERLERPEMLVGSTYKVKTPISDHAMYVTINDIILNEGTEFEKRRPFEIFINSKNSRPLPVDRRADADHFRRIPQRRRRHVSRR